MVVTICSSIYEQKINSFSIPVSKFRHLYGTFGVWSLENLVIIVNMIIIIVVVVVVVSWHWFLMKNWVIFSIILTWTFIKSTYIVYKYKLDRRLTTDSIHLGYIKTESGLLVSLKSKRERKNLCNDTDTDTHYTFCYLWFT